MQPWIKSAETFTWKECNACWSFRNLHQINLLQWCTANKSLWEVITGISSWVGVGIPIPLSKFCFRMQNKTHNASRWKHWENIFEWNSWIFIDRNRSAVTGMEKHLHSEPELPNSQLGIVMHTFRKVRKETQPSVQLQIMPLCRCTTQLLWRKIHYYSEYWGHRETEPDLRDAEQCNQR